MTQFILPDLGEGLAEAEIIEWLVEPGEHVHADQLLVTVETAKSMVDIPAPFEGTIQHIYGKAGDTILVGHPLVDFYGNTSVPEASTTLVGEVEISIEVVNEIAHPAAHSAAHKASPAVRALAKQLCIDLTQLKGSGYQGAITREDVLRASQTQQR